MKSRNICLKESTGRTISSTIRRADGRKLLAKGHVISEEDAHILAAEGLNEVWVTELEEDEVGEDDAVMQVAAKIGRGPLDVRLAAGGRANLFATEPCCILVDDEVLRRINSGRGMVVATSRNFTYADAGHRVASVKSAPFVVAKPDLEVLMSVVEGTRPMLQALPIRKPAVTILYTDPVGGERARQLLENVMRQRLNRIGTSASVTLSSVEEEGAVADSLEHLLRAKPTAVLIASTTAPARPDDVIGRALARAGSKIECFLAPVEPGSLLLLGYKDQVPILCAPGCFRPARPNVLDLILPPLLAGHRVSKWEVAGLGHGGLLV
jgi:molybdenum cofactor cytidylyltransferase